MGYSCPSMEGGVIVRRDTSTIPHVVFSFAHCMGSDYGIRTWFIEKPLISEMLPY